jgi:GNAT superfamily N-acetyltransferase
MSDGAPDSTGTRGVRVEAWDPAHPRWAVLLALIADLGQTGWVAFSADFHQTTHMLVALDADRIAGFLRYVVQAIGPDAGCPSVAIDGRTLREAKILAFGVDPARQRQGIGRALQLRCIADARERGCYQVRSHSGGDHPANHQLKLALGFGVHPILRGDDTRGAYYILPLGPLAARS